MTKPFGECLTPAAIILYHPVEEELATLLEAVDRNNRHIFIAINSVLDEAVEKRIKDLSHATIVRFEHNIGQGAALNMVMNAADKQGFKHLVLFDQDSAPEPCMIEQLKERMVTKEAQGCKIAAIGPFLTTPKGENYRPLRYSWRNKAQGFANFIPTSGSLIPLEAWKIIGPFRENYFIGGIDVEWGFRSQREGFVCCMASDITMVHRWGTSSKDKQGWTPQILRQSDARNYLYLRNAVDSLRLSHISRIWKMRCGIILAAQIIALMSSSVITGTRRQWIFQALINGWNGRLGPLPSHITPGQ
jgi:rhamnosyltransferase